MYEYYLYVCTCKNIYIYTQHIYMPMYVCMWTGKWIDSLSILINIELV